MQLGMMYRPFSLIVLFVVAVGTSCQLQDRPSVSTGTREVQDDLGRTVRIPEQIERAISLAPSLTEMIFAVGAGDRLVGVTTYCNYPAQTTSLEKVGDTLTPNIERIIALKPNVVFVSTDSQLEAFSNTLQEQGIAVYVTSPKSIEGVLKNMRQIGAVLGTQQHAENAVAALERRVSLIQQQVARSSGDVPRVFIQISNEPLFTVGSDSFLTELVQRAGGISVTKDVPSGYPKLSKETAVALDPDVIILSDSDDNREPNAVFKDSNAVKAGRVYRINADILSRPGPRLVDALEQIADRLRGQN